MTVGYMRIFDISRPIARGEPAYPGNPRPILRRIKTFQRGGSTLSELSLGLHTASHVDAPLHYVWEGKSIEAVPLTKCLGWCRVVRVGNAKTEIGEKQVRKIRPKKGEILLFKTKNSLPARSRQFYKDFAHINEAAARLLVKAKIKAVGIDGPSIRKFRLRPDTVHPLLLKAGIPIFEGLDFSGVKPGRYYFIGLPLKIVFGEASPVRAVLVR